MKYMTYPAIVWVLVKLIADNYDYFIKDVMPHTWSIKYSINEIVLNIEMVAQLCRKKMTLNFIDYVTKFSKLSLNREEIDNAAR